MRGFLRKCCVPASHPRLPPCTEEITARSIPSELRHPAVVDQTSCPRLPRAEEAHNRLPVSSEMKHGVPGHGKAALTDFLPVIEADAGKDAAAV